MTQWYDLEVAYRLPSDFYGLQIVTSPHIKEDQIYLIGNTIVRGTSPLTESEKWVKENLKQVFRSGRMLDWYEYIGEK